VKPQKLNEFLDWEGPELVSIIDQGILYSGCKFILYGKYKSFKSMLAQRLMFCLAAGEPWLGFKTPAKGISTMYLQLELPHRLLQRRIRKMQNGSNGLVKDLWFWTEHYLKLDQDLGIQILDSVLDQYKPEVLIIDPVYKVLTGSVSKPEIVTNFLDGLDRLMEKHQFALVLIAHSRKPIPGHVDAWGTDDLLGTSIFNNWADTVGKVVREERLIRVSFDVVRHAEEEIEPVLVEVDPDLRLVPRERRL
jgi:RecA-family ATPase